MKQQEYEEARELLLLEAKLVRLRIEAENLKLRKEEERKIRQGNQLIKLADVAYQLSQTRLLSQRSLFSTSRRRHWIWLVLAVILGLSR
jgi:putative coiled-coil domain-containing protein 128